MEKQHIWLVILLLLLVSVLLIFTISYSNNSINARVIENSKLDSYIYTKAMCNSTNFCQDYKIVCEGKKTIETAPITGAFIQHDESWKDPRKNNSEELCG